MTEKNNNYNINNTKREYNNKSPFELNEESINGNNFMYSHRELNSNYLNQDEKNQPINIYSNNNNKEENIINIYPNINTGNMNKNANRINPIKINNFDENIKEAKLEEKKMKTKMKIKEKII